jgi:hypothetical protein
MEQRHNLIISGIVKGKSFLHSFPSTNCHMHQTDGELLAHLCDFPFICGEDTNRTGDCLPKLENLLSLQKKEKLRPGTGTYK